LPSRSASAKRGGLPPASAGDRNIIISNKTERYVFDEGSKEHPVIIHQEDKTTYYCSELRTEISWAEFYDDQSSIDELMIYLNGSRDKTIQPKNEYSSVDFVYSTEFAMDGLLQHAGNNLLLSIGKAINSPLKMTASQRDRKADVYMPYARTLDCSVSFTIPRDIPSWEWKS